MYFIDIHSINGTTDSLGVTYFNYNKLKFNIYWSKYWLFLNNSFRKVYKVLEIFTSFNLENEIMAYIFYIKTFKWFIEDSFFPLIVFIIFLWAVRLLGTCWICKKSHEYMIIHWPILYLNYFKYNSFLKIYRFICIQCILKHNLYLICYILTWYKSKYPGLVLYVLVFQECMKYQTKF